MKILLVKMLYISSEYFKTFFFFSDQYLCHAYNNNNILETMDATMPEWQMHACMEQLCTILRFAANTHNTVKPHYTL